MLMMRYLESLWRRNLTAVKGQDLLDRHTSAIDRCQRQNHLTITKLLLGILVIIDHYGRHLPQILHCWPEVYLS